MADSPKGSGSRKLMAREHLAALFEALTGRGYRVVGPTVAESAIAFDEIESPDDLPEGWTDEQEGGTYRLKRRPDKALFGYTVGPHSWKRFLYPARQRLMEARRQGAGFEVVSPPPDAAPTAFLGVRACDLVALEVFGRAVDNADFSDSGYAARRSAAVVIAVNCGQAGGTCFCLSMQTGPRVGGGHDLALTELVDDGRHDFLVEVGSKLGAEILADVPHREAAAGDIAAAEAAVRRAEATMGRSMDTDDLPALLMRSLDHPQWDDVSGRCLTCGNCTLVCPTCFCTTVEDVTDLSGDVAERWRSWDSCFTLDHSYIHGGPIRRAARSRYRQWMTHKLATWHEQFGTSGCVGCGRCITWCPVAIDITAEVRAIRGDDGGTAHG